MSQSKPNSRKNTQEKARCRVGKIHQDTLDELITWHGRRSYREKKGID
jgi:hypothetical protein